MTLPNIYGKPLFDSKDAIQCEIDEKWTYLLLVTLTQFDEDLKNDPELPFERFGCKYLLGILVASHLYRSFILLSHSPQMPCNESEVPKTATKTFDLDRYDDRSAERVTKRDSDRSDFCSFLFWCTLHFPEKG